MGEKVEIRRLITNIPGLDDALGGGIPEFSFNLIAGPSGTGKTTLALQMLFALATREQRAIFFTILGEPPVKLLRYQQQFAFFDFDKLPDVVRFVNLADDVIHGGIQAAMARIAQEVEHTRPRFVVIDSFRTALQPRMERAGDTELRRFVQQLGTELTGWETTSFVVADYPSPDGQAKEGSRPNPLFTITDSVIWLDQACTDSAIVRHMHVTKMRGQSPIPGPQRFRISEDGIEVFSATRPG